MIESNLKQRLLFLRGTLKKVIALNGIGRLAVLLVGSVLLALLLDYFFFRWERPVNTAFRMLMLASFLGGIGWILYYKLIAPLSVPLNTDDMALAVEKEFPKLNDSLISTMQLTRMMATDGSVSTPMVEEVARQAHAHASTLDFSRVVKFDRVKPVLIAGGVALALFAILLAAPSRDFLTTAMLRLVNPLSNAKYPVRTKVNIKDARPEFTAPRNEALHIVALVSGDMPETAYIQFDYGTGFGSKEPITSVRTNVGPRENTKEFDFEYNPVLSDFKFVVLAGDSQSDPYKVRVVDRPRMENMEIVYKYPDYISETPSERKRDTKIQAVVGTKATMTFIANKALANASIKLGEAAPESIDSFSADRKTFTKQVDLDASKDYEIFLTDTEGWDNSKAKIRHRIVVQKDAVPIINWKRPATDLEVTAGAIVSLGMMLTDDYGLQKSLIKYKRFKMITPPAPAGGQNPPHPMIDTSQPAQEGTFDLVGEYGKSAQKLDISHEWALTEMNLQPGDMIEYWAEAYDWCPPTAARKPAEPQIFRLKILSPEELHRKLDIMRMRLVEDLIAIIRMEESDKKQVAAIADHLKLGNPFDTTQRSRVSEAGSIQEEIRRKTSMLQQGFLSLIAQYKSNGLDTPDETDRLREVAETLAVEHSQKMPEASKTIISSAQVKEEAARVTQLRQAESKQIEIIDDLNRLLAMMHKWQETEELLRMTRELLAKQKVVTTETIPFKEKLGAKQPAEANKDELALVKGLEQSQRACAIDMKNLFTRMTQALAKMQTLDKFAAKNIEDSIRVAQNTDATTENGALTSTGDNFPGIEDKMTAAQADIAKFNFGTANGKQKASEVALQTIITYLSRRREIDQKLMRDIADALKQAQKNLDEQQRLSRLNKAIKSNEDIQKSIAESRQRLNDLKQREAGILEQTRALDNKASAEAARLEAALSEARKDLETLIAEETAIKTETDAAMTPTESELAQSLNSLEEIEIAEREMAREINALAAKLPEKAEGAELKKAEKVMVDTADRQATARTSLDVIAARMAELVRNSAAEKPDSKAALAGKTTATAIPLLDEASKAMAEAADTFRQGSPFASKPSLAKGEKAQLLAADKIKAAREILQGASTDMGNDKKADHAKTGDKQGQTQGKANTLKEKLGKLADDINKAHAAASGKLESPPADANGAAGKVGEASEQMGKAKDALKKPDPSAASRGESKALAAMQTAQEKLKDLERKVDELKDPARRLERIQKDVKDQTRALAEEIKNIEDQLPSTVTEPKAQDDLKKAGNSMQNAQNSLSGAKSGDPKKGGGDPKQGGGDPKQGGGDPKQGGSPQQQQANKKDAEKHEEQALSELDKALAKLDELSAKAKKEGDNHQAAALKRTQVQQLTAREDVEKLQAKLNEMNNKTGNERADRAAKSNENAARKQSQASAQMGQGQQPQSQASQKEAEEDLQDVLDNLQQLQQQMQQQQNKEKLFQIEQELKKMLEIQNDVSKRTKDADKLAAGRPKKLTLIQIFKVQLELADSTKVIVKKLEEAPAFQFVLQEAVEDMTEAATRLDKENAGTSTQEIQDDASKKIADLIEALRKERTEPKKGGGGGSGGGKQPLVPSLAQMKMLRIMQRDVNNRVKKLDAEVNSGKTPDMNKDQLDRLRRAAEVQGKIARVMQKTADELEGNAVPQRDKQDKKDDEN